MLSSKTISVIRKILSEQCSRNQIKQFLLEAGARAERILPVPVIGNMKSKDYHSVGSLLSLMFDSVYADFNRDDADKILLNLLRILRNKGVSIFLAEEPLRADGVELGEITSGGIDGHLGRRSLPDESDGAKTQTAGIRESITAGQVFEYDFFISHAGEDKDSVARPLANLLIQKGLKVDDFVKSQFA